MQVREASSGDAIEVSRLLHELHPDLQVSSPTLEVSQQSNWFVVESEGMIAGCALATSVTYHGNGYGMIEELIVKEAFRNQGIGHALLRACGRWFTDTNIEVVFVSAIDDAAAAFYRHHHFTPCVGPWLYTIPQSLLVGKTRN